MAKRGWTRGALVLGCGVLLLATSRADAGPDWVDESQQRLLKAMAAPDAKEWLPAALDQVWAALRKERASRRGNNALDRVLEPVARAARMDEPEIRRAAWRVAGASGVAAGISILADALQRCEGKPGLVSTLLLAVRDSGSPASHTWFVSEAAAVWALPVADRKAAVLEFARTLDACLLTLVDGSSGDVRKLAAVVGDALSGADGELRSQLATALARTPGPASRKLLRTWLAKVRNIPAALVVSVLENLPIGGDAEAIPIVLDQLADTPAPVLEACLYALASMKPEVLRASGKLIVRETGKVAEREYREYRSLVQRGKRSPQQEQRLTLLIARSEAWKTKRVQDSPPDPLPKEAQGWTGITALWWRVIDTKPRGMRAPKASKNTRLPSLFNRPNPSWDEWMTWCKRGR